MISSPLVPRPRRIEPLGGVLDLEGGLELRTAGDRQGVAAALARLARTLGREVDDDRPLASALRLERSQDVEGGEEGYQLSITGEGILVRSASAAGLSHGLSTLAQWVRPSGGRSSKRVAPMVAIEDSPAIANRGVMLDVSRSRIPTMESLFDEIDRLAGWKVNQLQLYVEHTFAYRGHEEVWRGSDPLTGNEVRRLDEYCRQRHIELVPNQNSFGHLHRWLEHPRYRHLAECPEGLEHPFADVPTPFSLCPTDAGSIELLEDLYAQLLPNFSSRQMHIGFDETMDLGTGRSRRRAEEIGVPRLYADFLSAVSRLARKHGRRVQFWGDIVAKHDELLAHVPEHAIVTDWGYEADHPFGERAEKLRSAGLENYLCPGTSSWLSLAGRWSNAVENITAAAVAAAARDSSGLLITDWGDQGHLQPPVIRMPPVLLAAALSWNPGSAADLDRDEIAGLIDLHLFGRSPGDGPGATLTGLGDVYRLPGGGTFNGSPLFYLLTRPDMELDHSRLRGLMPEGLEASSDALEALRLPGELGGELEGELAFVWKALDVAVRLGADRLRHSAANSCRELPAVSRSDLAERLDELLALHRELWLESSRPGGLDESAGVIERTREALRTPDPGA